MGTRTRTRTRPDELRKAGKITAEGYRALQEESARQWSAERPKVTEGVATAAAEGDRSENAEYTYGKMKLAAIDLRLKYIGDRLEVLAVVSRWDAIAAVLDALGLSSEGRALVKNRGPPNQQMSLPLPVTDEVQADAA